MNTLKFQLLPRCAAGDWGRELEMYRDIEYDAAPLARAMLSVVPYQTNHYSFLLRFQVNPTYALRRRHVPILKVKCEQGCASASVGAFRVRKENLLVAMLCTCRRLTTSTLLESVLIA